MYALVANNHPQQNREQRSRCGLTARATVIRVHGIVASELLVPINVALKEWGPAQVSEITEVSPALQRQWRKQGVLTPLTEGKRSRFNIITISYVWAARILIDNGAGHRQIDRLVNELGFQIFANAMTLGEYEAHPPLTQQEARAAVDANDMVGSSMRRRYFVFRNDQAAIGSDHRAASFHHLENVAQWMVHGQKLDEPEDIAAEEAHQQYVATLPPLEDDEDDEDLEPWDPPAPHPALPRTNAAVVIDLEEAALQLVHRCGFIGDVYDTDRDPRLARIERGALDRALAEMQSLNDEMDRLTAELEATSPGPRSVEITKRLEVLFAQHGWLSERADRLLALMKLHAELLRAQHGGPDQAPDPKAAARLEAQIATLKKEL